MTAKSGRVPRKATGKPPEKATERLREVAVQEATWKNAGKTPVGATGSAGKSETRDERRQETQAESPQFIHRIDRQRGAGPLFAGVGGIPDGRRHEDGRHAAAEHRRDGRTAQRTLGGGARGHQPHADGRRAGGHHRLLVEGGED